MKRVSLTLTVTLMLALCMHRLSAQHVWTQHNNQERTGWYQSETVLDQSNVNKNTFGLKFSCTTDDQVLSQPLVMMHVNLPNGVGSKNVVYMATTNNTIYCYDAEKNGNAYWSKNYTNVNNLGGGARPAQNTDMHPSLCLYGYNDITGNPGNMGIVGTPVIDSTTNTMYFVTKVAKGPIVNNTPADTAGHYPEYYYPSTGFHQFLHAISITDGSERPNSPVEISASAVGTGDAGIAGRVYFEPRRNFQHAGLALANGQVYIAWGAHCDFNPSHGWIMAYDKTSLVQNKAFCTTPNSGRGGIWMAGGAPAVDAAGHIYFTDGNSLDEDAPSDPSSTQSQHNRYDAKPSVLENRGQSVIELNPDLSMKSYFTPYDYKFDNDGDLDFGQQVMIIPGTDKVMTGVKYFKMYVMTQNALGGYHTGADSASIQTIGLGNNTTGHSNFAYFGGGASKNFLYQASENSPVTAFKVNGDGTLVTPGVQGSQSIPNPTGLAGAYLSVSSDKLDPATAILWSYMPQNCGGNGCPGILRAFNALDIRTELYNTEMNSSRDRPPGYAKMVAPTITLGNVYLPSTANRVLVYGLTADGSCSQNVALARPATSYTSNGSNTTVGGDCCQPGLAFDGDPNPGDQSRWAGNGSNNNYLQVDLGARYDICKITASFEKAGWPKDYAFQVSDDGVTFTDAYRKLGYDGTGLYQEHSGTFSGRYVRFQGITVGTPYGYQIYEFQVFGTPSAACGTPTNIVSTPVNDSTETVSWAAVPGATSYIFKYHYNVDSYVTKTVTSPTVTITHLQCDSSSYNTSIQAICPAGNSAVQNDGFTTGVCGLAGNCDAMPTRAITADFGDIGARGSVCRQSTVFTLKGSGTGTTGTADQFRLYWLNLNGDFSDHEVLAKLVNQDPGSANGTFGVMIRRDLTDVSPFVYLASVNNGQSFVLQYRSTAGGAVTSNPLPGHSLPYYVKLSKTGSSYTPYFSENNVNWTAASAPVNVGTFGTDAGHPITYGVAISSASNTALATGVFDAFDIPSSTPLPIKLSAFKATNINNDHVLISWSTTMEQNVEHYELQRAGDDGTFQAIGEIDAVGNSDVPNNYTFTDKSPLTGTNFYRLKEIDQDNKSYLSPVTHVDFGVEKELQIFPNPVTNYISITSNTGPLLEVTLYDVSGKIMQSKTSTGGVSTIRLNTGSLSRGLYIVRAKTKDKTYQQKIVKK